MTIVFPLLPFLLGQYLPDSQVVIGMGAMAAVYALCTFFTAPIYGALSDRYGRKFILVASLLGTVVGYVLFGVGGALWILFLGRIIDGLTAGDITKPEERTKWYGYLGGAIGIGFMVGPALGGLLGSLSLSLPFYVTAGIFFLCAVVTAVFLPESLKPENRSADLTAQSFNPFGQFQGIFALKEAASLLVVGAFFSVAIGVYQFNFSVFMKDLYSWGPALIGGMLTVVGLCDILSRTVLLPLLLKKFSERAVGLAGLGGFTLGMALLVVSIFAHSVIWVGLAIVAITLGEGLFDPAFNGRLSQSVDESSQGKLQGVNQSLQSAYHILVPLGATALYLASPAALYGIATILVVGAVVLFSGLKVPRGLHESRQGPSESQPGVGAAFGGVGPKAGHLFDVVAELLAEVHQEQGQGQQAHRTGKDQHVGPGVDLHGQHELEELHDEGHDDHLADLVLEHIKTSNIEDVRRFGLVGGVDVADEQLVEAEAEDQKHHGDEEDVHATDDGADHFDVDVDVVVATHGIYQQVEDDLDDVEGPQKEQAKRGGQTRQDRKQHEEPAGPKEFLEELLDGVGLPLVVVEKVGPRFLRAKFRHAFLRRASYKNRPAGSRVCGPEEREDLAALLR